MRYLLILILFSGCTAFGEQTVIEKCPKGQVMVVENKGLSDEAKKCYTPGVSYTDFRPVTIEVEK